MVERTVRAADATDRLRGAGHQHLPAIEHRAGLLSVAAEAELATLGLAIAPQPLLPTLAANYTAAAGLGHRMLIGGTTAHLESLLVVLVRFRDRCDRD